MIYNLENKQSLLKALNNNKDTLTRLDKRFNDYRLKELIKQTIHCINILNNLNTEKKYAQKTIHLIAAHNKIISQIFEAFKRDLK